MDVWIGTNYKLSPSRILILGESWYGDADPLAEYVPWWILKQVRDNTFARVFNAASGFHTESASVAQRSGWWNSIAFYNFVPGSVGENRTDRPTRAVFLAAREPLRAVLEQLRPNGVWILGKEQTDYSAGVVERLGITFEVTPHPTAYGVATRTLADSWAELVQRARGDRKDA
ncbi:MAG: hypothetical protein U0570_00315 [Phycisphaerales bacterium]